MTLSRHLLAVCANDAEMRRAMDRLQAAGIVSDNAVNTEGVADCDAERAIEFLKGKTK